MTSIIQNYLEELEKERGIKILYACETGSRAWGFPSPDSDYDIRIIYVHPIDWYLTINEQKDSLEVMLENNDLDITGWELRKALRLMAKSNAALIERVQSPIIYRKNEAFLADIQALATTTYSRIGTIHHYGSMAKKCLDEIKGERQFKLKKFFYALRAASTCLWILEKDEMPPIEFSIILNELKDIQVHKVKIEELIQLKSTISESYLHEGEAELFKFMDDCMQRTDSEAAALPASKGKLDDLNIFLSHHIHTSWT